MAFAKTSRELGGADRAAGRRSPLGLRHILISEEITCLGDGHSNRSSHLTDRRDIPFESHELFLVRGQNFHQILSELFGSFAACLAHVILKFEAEP